MGQEQRRRILVHISREGAQIDMGHAPDQGGVPATVAFRAQAQSGARQRGVADIGEARVRYIRREPDDLGMGDIQMSPNPPAM